MHHLTGLFKVATTLLLMMAGLLAQAGTVTLNGEGTVHFQPDAVRFELTAQARGDSAAAARQAVGKRVTKWQDQADDLLGKLQNYDDSQVTLHEVRVYDDNGRPTEDYYFEASQSVRFNLTELALLNSVIEAADAADLTYNLTQDSYYATQSNELKSAALAAAIQDAQARCRFVAEKLDARCGEVETLRVLDQGGFPRPVMRAMDARAESVSKVGDREISASVEASFKLDQAVPD
ncbi:MAG: hypothetical protein CL583_19050 [Alteromonadaceae bacterium]|nr:hypothetical protein [Alteromonadaceae bacterium]